MSKSKLTSCGYCNNISQMEITGSVSDTIVDDDPEYGFIAEYGTIYNVLKCPACKKTNIVSYHWNDSIESVDHIEYKLLFPKSPDFPIGLPENILSTYKAAEKIKTIDVNAYVILLRRLLELVCMDRNANGDTLAAMLKDLANRKEIPDKLVKVATGLKDFGNIGAHAGIGNLSEDEIPIINALINAILEYIYSAPHLATLAEEKLKTIKTKKYGG